LLSALPVVPLEEINARVRHRRRLAFTGALALAVLLGGCAALLMAHFEQGGIESSVTDSSQPAQTETGENRAQQVETPAAVVESNTAAHMPNDSPLVVNNDHDESSGGMASKAVASSKRALPRTTDTRLSTNVAKANAAIDESADETAQAMSDQRARRLQRWEERRLRRETFRDRRASNRASGDDLFRIREIFEGTRRPH
jgi:hypothetical protein